MAKATRQSCVPVPGSGVITFLTCAAIFLGLACLLMANSSGADFSLVLLPFGYAFFMLVIGRDNVVRWAPGIAVLNILLFLRFVLMPAAMCLTGEVSVYILDASNRPYGVPLMLYELMGVGFVLKLTAKKQHEYARSIQQPSDDGLYYGNIIAVVAIVVLVLLAYRYRYLISGFSLITEGSVEGYTDEDLASGVVVAIWDSLLAWVYVWFLLVMRRRSKSELATVVWAVVDTFAFLIMVYIGQVTVSRWHTVIAFVAALFCLMCIFPYHKKGLLLSVTIPVLVLIITASAFKNSTYSWAGITYSQALRQLFDVSTFDIYLAGPSTVSDGVTMYQHLGPFNFVALFVDTVQNLPFVNHWVDKSLSTVYAYHLYWQRGDLIMPLIGQSMAYFGWPFAPVMSMFSVWFVRFFDRLAYRATSLPHAFIAGFGGAWFGVATVLNVTITMSWVGLRIVPFYFLIWLTELVGRRSQRMQGEDLARMQQPLSQDREMNREGGEAL
jgi:hypothetical protein